MSISVVLTVAEMDNDHVVLHEKNNNNNISLNMLGFFYPEEAIIVLIVDHEIQWTWYQGTAANGPVS